MKCFAVRSMVVMSYGGTGLHYLFWKRNTGPTQTHLKSQFIFQKVEGL